MKSFNCFDCGVDTSPGAGIAEYYHVRDEVWKHAPRQDCMLCVGCLELRLGRELTPSDFSDAPVNYGFFPRSGRLAERVGR